MARNRKKNRTFRVSRGGRRLAETRNRFGEKRKTIFDNAKFANILPSNLFIPTFKSVKFDVFKTVVNHLYFNHLSVFFRENLI